MQTINWYIRIIGMKFGIEIWATLIMKIGERETTKELPHQERIRTHEEKENYKCLGIWEAAKQTDERKNKKRVPKNN